ncbi:hypothetical protein [uncultured Selenomonas sp.]|uniref:hypothetical protein n=1 Tax=uncultured Selenomonas sp. TaxID=159275 RepID=UPI0028E6AFBD|nr:hypothetical protein [uncultured Selenomonas sp.]
MKKLEGRHLALMIGIAVSGAVLFPQDTAAADVTGHDIVSSRDWTGPDTNPRAAGYIGSANDNGNVYGNTLTVNSTHHPPHALNQGYIAAGYTEGGGDTYGNRLVILPGAHLTGRVSGGHLDGAALSGRTHHNTVIMRGGRVTDEIYGGNVTGTNGLRVGDAEWNTVEMSDGRAEEGVYGGRVRKSGNARHNTVHISGGWANIAGGGIAPQESGGRGGNAEDNHLIVSGGTVNSAAVGGVARRGKALRNTVEITGGRLRIVYGGSGRQADGNRVAISGGDISRTVIGGFSGTGSANNNSVAITGGSVHGNVYGGYSINGSAEGNVVTLDGVHTQGDVYGGYAARASKNTINLKNGAEVDGVIFGGFSDGNRENNNLLAIHGVGTAKAEKLFYVQHLDFYLDPMASPASPTRLQLRTRRQSLSGVSVGVGVEGHALVLRPGDTVSLLRVAPGGTLDIAGMERETETMQGVSLSYAFDVWRRGNEELVATLRASTVNPRTRSLVETRTATNELINRGADLLASVGMGAADDDRERRRQYGIWAVMQKSSMRTRTDSDIDLRASNMAVGASRIFARKGGELLFSPFVEYATGKYDSYMGDGTHGSGDLSYLGTGVLARMDRTNGAWMEAVLHGGSTKANYRGQVHTSRLTTYRYTAPYWAMQLGVGKMRPVGRAAQLDCYVRYFWSHTNGASARLNSGETYDFHATDSHRLRAGARYTRHNSASALYAGLALEYEMGNGAAAHFQSYEIPASGAAGVSALMELGWRSAPKHGRVTCEVNLSGWQGRRSGWMGSAHIDWKF